MLEDTQNRQYGNLAPAHDLEEDRIAWERKQKGKRRQKAHADLDEDAQAYLYLRERDEPRKKGKARSKKRQLVYDEATGRMIVKRRRRPHRDAADDLEEWDF